MKYELPCEIVQDLLPSYIDELTSETTSASVEGHLEICPECRNLYETMKSPGGIPDADAIAHQAEERQELDFLKKTRSRGRRGILRAVAAAFLCAAVVFVISLFTIGHVVSSGMIDYRISHDTDGFTFSGSLVDYRYGVSDITWEETDGTLNLKVKSTMASFLNPNEFEACYQPSGEIRRVTINDSVVIWDEGTHITPLVSRLYSLRTPYVGSFPDIQALAQAIGLPEYLDYSGNRLETTETPYRWILEAGESVTQETCEEYQQTLPRYAAILIAMIGNLDEMEFQLNVEGELRSIVVTESDADTLTGRDVKACGQSPKELQAMVADLGLYSQPVFQDEAEYFVDDNFDFFIDLQTEDEIYGLSVALIADGEVLCSTSMINADESALNRGVISGFLFTPEVFAREIDMEEAQVEVRISLYGESADLTNLYGQALLSIDPDEDTYYDGNTYSRTLKLTGDQKKGYTLE